MIIEQHYDEEVLAEFLAEPSDAVTRDKHLGSCNLCLKTLDSLRASAQILREPAVWDKTPISTAPRPETLAFLRNVQKTMADEDATAAVWIKQLLAGSRETWAPRLAEHPEWRTGGMVRALMKAGDETIHTMPTDSEAAAMLAAIIADALPDVLYPVSMKAHLRALAHYEYGYALWYLGALQEALSELDTAEACLRGKPATDLDCARITVVRALIYQVLERRSEALDMAAAAAAIFRRFGDVNRFVAARSVAAVTLQEARRLREALAVHNEIATNESIDEQWRVSAIHNMALCHRDLGEIAQARNCLVAAISSYERLGMFTFRSKSRWALADLFAREGRFDDAVNLYRELRSEFEELSMASDVALVSLDTADCLIALNRTAEVGDVCRSALSYFSSAGLSRTEPALRGLAYLQEVLVAGRLSKREVNEVRTFILAPQKAPELLFAELPPPA